MTPKAKAELKKQIEELRAQVAELRARVELIEARPLPVVGNELYQRNPYQPDVWCLAHHEPIG